MPPRLTFPDLDPDWRIETKYRIPLRQYYALKNALTPYVSPDTFTRSSPSKRYIVRSLYFDTYNFQLYREKVSGNCNRIKFRFRSYEPSPSTNGKIRVEMKVRKSGIMEKYGCFVPNALVLKGNKLPLNTSPVLVEFARFQYRWRLIPVTLVQYSREGYRSKAHDGIRITFDHNISSASASELFPQKIWWRRHYEQQVVFEIKHQHQMPNWIEDIIKYYNLRVVANSKYAMSVENGRNDLILPPWRQI